MKKLLTPFFLSLFSIGVFSQSIDCSEFTDLTETIKEQVRPDFNELPDEDGYFSGNSRLNEIGRCFLERYSERSLYQIPDEMEWDDPLLVCLVLASRSIETEEEKQSWFNLYPLMNETQINKLYNILVREFNKLAAIEERYEKQRAGLAGRYLEMGDEGLSALLNDRSEECEWIRQTEPDDIKAFEECEYTFDIAIARYLIQKAEQETDLEEKHKINVDAFLTFEKAFLQVRVSFQPPYQSDFTVFRNHIYALRQIEDGKMLNFPEMLDFRKRYAEVIEFVSPFLDTEYYKSQIASTYGNLSYYYLLNNQIVEAEEAAVKALDADPTQVWIKTNLGHSYLFQGRFDEAINIYNSIKLLKDSPSERVFSDILLSDFEELEENGITHPDIERARAIISN